MDTHCLLAPPSEQVLGARVPESDDPVRIQRDDSLIGKTLDDETKNVLGEVPAVLSPLLSHGMVPIGCRGQMNCRGPTLAPRDSASCQHHPLS